MIEKLVSVVLPVYNRADTVNRAIDSVLFQTYSNIELIVVDDGSEDGTLENIQAYTDKRIRIICQKHGGANKARNTGMKYSRGEYIAFQDSDDEWLPDKLMTQICYMKEHASDVCYSSFYSHIGNETKIIPLDHQNREKHETNLAESLRKGNSIGTPTLVIHASVLDRMPERGFDEALPRLQDYDFAIRLAQVSSIAYIDTPLVHAYKSADSISINNEFLIQAVHVLLQKHEGVIDAESLFGVTLDSRAYHQNTDEVLSALDDAQKYIPEEILNCRDALILHMIKVLRRQYKLLIKQYENAMEHVTDREFAIYGAGNIGKKIYQRLLGRNVRPGCFLVTEKGKDDYIDDIPIISLDEFHNTQQMIIIGVDGELQDELVDNLISRGFLSFCVYQKEK